MRNGLRQTIKQTLCMFYERFQGLEVYNASNHVHWFYWGWIKWSWNGLLRHRTMYLNTFHLLFPPLPTKKRCITIKKTKSCKCSRLQNRVDSCGASRKAFENSCLARANPDSAPARNREVRPSDRMGWIPCTSDQTIEHLGGLQWWWTIEIGLCILCITANGDIFAGEQSVFRGVDFRGGGYSNILCWVYRRATVRDAPYCFVASSHRRDEAGPSAGRLVWQTTATANGLRPQGIKALIVIIVGVFLFSVRMGSGLTDVL